VPRLSACSTRSAANRGGAAAICLLETRSRQQGGGAAAICLLENVTGREGIQGPRGATNAVARCALSVRPESS
jgi:hypothetical protein